MPTQLVLTVAAVAGLLAGGLYLSVLVGPAFILFQYFTQLPLFMVGLGVGIIAVLLSGCVAFVVAMIAEPILGLVFLVGYVGPTLLVTHRALLNRSVKENQLEWYPIGRLLAEISIYVTAVVVLGVIWLTVQDGGLEGAIESLVSQLRSILGADVARGGDLLLSQNGFVVPGLIGISWIVMMVINGSLAQWLLRRSGRNLRPSSALQDVKLPTWLGYLLGVSILALLWGNGALSFAGGAAMMILMTPFFFQGVGVVHQWCSRSSSGNLILVVFYLLMLVLQWPILLVIVFGIVDQWFDLRRQGAA